MALNAIFEVVIHFESFRNIDLFHQGLYQLQATLSYSLQGETQASPIQQQKLPTYPVFTLASRVSREKRRKLKHNDPHHIISAKLNEPTNSFSTRGFVIRYCEEEVEINDMGCFRVEIEVKPGYQATTFELEIELLFSDIMATELVAGAPPSIEKWQQIAANPESIPEIKSVAKQKLKLNGLLYGMNEMSQVVFDDQHFSCTQVTIHSTLVDFRWRSIPSQAQILRSTARKPASAEEARRGMQIPAPQTFAQFLFMDERGKLQETLMIPPGKVNQIYDEYINQLATSFERLHQKYNTFYSHCLSDKMKRECGLPSTAPVLILPGEENPSTSEYSQHHIQQQQPFLVDEKEISIELGQQCDKPGLNLEQPQPKPQSPAPLTFNENNNEEQKNENSIYTHPDDESTNEMKNITSVPTTMQKQLNLGNGDPSLQPHPRVVPFTQRVPDLRPNTVALQMQRDFAFISGQIFIMWHKLLELINVSPRFVQDFLQEAFEDRIRAKWGENIFRDVQTTQDFAIPKEQNVGELHKRIAKKRRAYDLEELGLTSLMPIEDTNMFPKGEAHPILFEQVYHFTENQIGMGGDIGGAGTSKFELSEQIDRWQTEKRDYKGNHLFVLVHGFQGNSHDMRLFKDNIALRHPEAMFLCSMQNQEDTEGDIQEMGEKLAKEITEYIEEWCPTNALGRISFIGHSMGGLIIRASLKHLTDLKEKMHLYISLSTPHLGYMYNSNRIVDAGIWLLKKWRKSKCLQQLTMSDHPEQKETFLYRLSKQKGLQWFKHLILVSSYQDQYAPFDSARIQICTKAATDPLQEALILRRGNLYIEMARNILSDLKTEILYRIDVNFQINEKNLDSFIGRTAHIQFLECQPLMKMIIFKYPEFFS